MITGYNTEVKRQGRVYHVQTEDKGVKNPIIETLVYVGGGQIIHSQQYNYAGLVRNGACDEKALQELLESQHRRIMRWIAGGKFDEDGPPPFGSTIVSGRTFDEVVMEFLKEQESSEPIEVVLAEDAQAVAGTEARLRLQVRGSGSRKPSPGARVNVVLNPRLGKTQKLAAAAADKDGLIEVTVRLPADAAGGFVQVEAQSAGSVGALEIPVTKGAAE